MFQPFICWSVAFECQPLTFNKTISTVSTLYLLECGFWIRCFSSVPPTSLMFQPFICWSVAFEFPHPHLHLNSLRCFNPLFVGVWLLNISVRQQISSPPYVSTLYLLECGFWIRTLEVTMLIRIMFQPFICWSVAFEFVGLLLELLLGDVSTLYLLECGFWIFKVIVSTPSLNGFNPLFVGVWLLNSWKGFKVEVMSMFQPFICWSVAFEWAV